MRKSDRKRSTLCTDFVFNMHANTFSRHTRLISLYALWGAHGRTRMHLVKSVRRSFRFGGDGGDPPRVPYNYRPLAWYYFGSSTRMAASGARRVQARGAAARIAQNMSNVVVKRVAWVTAFGEEHAHPSHGYAAVLIARYTTAASRARARFGPLRASARDVWDPGYHDLVIDMLMLGSYCGVWGACDVRLHRMSVCKDRRISFIEGNNVLYKTLTLIDSSVAIWKFCEITTNHLLTCDSKNLWWLQLNQN